MGHQGMKRLPGKPAERQCMHPTRLEGMCVLHERPNEQTSKCTNK